MRLASYQIRAAGRASARSWATAWSICGCASVRGFRPCSTCCARTRSTRREAALPACGRTIPLAEVELLPPLPAPEKIVCIGINYANRNAEYEEPQTCRNIPSMFYRAPESLVGHGQPLVRPKVSEQLDYEGEIALVIGREGRHVPRERALERRRRLHAVQRRHGARLDRHGKFNVTQGKNFDASGSIGPWMETDVDLTKPLRLARK